jgi:hypothetical protein
MLNKGIFSLLIGFLLLCSGCVPSCRNIYKDDKVSVKESSLVNILNVHASKDKIIITVYGKSYEDVRGNPPYYLEIPGENSILFVTGRTFDNGQATVHIVNLATKQETNFPAYDSSIGEAICSTNKQRDDWYERIEGLTNDELSICAVMSNRRFRYILDLKKPEFVREEQGWVGFTNIVVVPGGKTQKQK